MSITLYSKDIKDYLRSTDIIDFDNATVANLSDELAQRSKDETDYIKQAYEYVRDNISHSADANEDRITCSASEVLEEGHGICFAKSHLLAALLRRQSIPAGFVIKN